MTVPDLETIIRAFEKSWQRRDPWRVEEFPTHCGDLMSAQRRELLLELVAIDMEFRWRLSTNGEKRFERKTLEDYARQIPELRDPPVEIIAEEYRCRAHWDDSANAAASLLQRYPSRDESIRSLIASVDIELQIERDSTFEHLAKPVSEQPALSTRGRLGDEPDSLNWSDYVLQKRIGVGRTGHIYRALERTTGRIVAIKFLRKLFWQDRDTTRRFLDEAGILREPTHPGLLPLRGFGRTPRGSYFMAMDLAAGGSLEEVIRARRVTIDESIRWTIEACDAMQHMHERGIIHCDLKPANLLLGDRSQILVADFGLACSVAEERTADLQIAGTAPYMAPEQVSSYWGPLSPRTDVYGLGAVLYTLLTGIPPHSGRNAAEVLARVASGVPVTPPCQLRPEVSAGLNDTCLRALAKHPDERYASTHAFAADLRASSR